MYVYAAEIFGTALFQIYMLKIYVNFALENSCFSIPIASSLPHLLGINYDYTFSVSSLKHVMLTRKGWDRKIVWRRKGLHYLKKV